VQKAEGAGGRNQVRGVYCTLWVVRKSQQPKPQLLHFCETKEKNCQVNSKTSCAKGCLG